MQFVALGTNTTHLTDAGLPRSEGVLKVLAVLEHTPTMPKLIVVGELPPKGGDRSQGSQSEYTSPVLKRSLTTSTAVEAYLF